MFKADLHVHSSVSDGRYSPAEIIRKAVASGLKVIALTDHDTIDGIDEALSAARAFPDLIFIPGVEVSTDTSNGQVHVLGYFIEYTNQGFRDSLEKMRNSRLERAVKMVEKLDELGCNIKWERVREIAGEGSIGRPHIAQALLEKGYIANFKEAFSKYIGHDCPAYVEREKLTPAEAVQLVLAANGLPVLAHPLTVAEMETTIRELKANGLVGIETYYGEYSPKEVNILLDIAVKYDLIPTGGTDYHGINNADEKNIGGVEIPEHYVRELINRARKRE